MQYLIPLLLCWGSLSLSAEQSYWLKRVSNIEDPMGFWALPQGSLDNWSKIKLVIARGSSQAKLYMTYDFSPSDAPPPYSAAEYQANISLREIMLVKGDLSLYIEDSTKERQIDNQKRITGCAVSTAKGALPFAYCTTNDGGISFNMISGTDALLARFYSEAGKWKVNIYRDGQKNINKTAALLLAALRLWRTKN